LRSDRDQNFTQIHSISFFCISKQYQLGGLKILDLMDNLGQESGKVYTEGENGFQLIFFTRWKRKSANIYLAFSGGGG
jgi:hypothetical protein